MPGSKPWPEVRVGNKDHANATVVIIGAGLSGMCTAIDLIKRNNCRNFIILERSSSFGGTWLDNKYPGCCCDVWSMLYSYSFSQKSDWTREYPGQEEILAYLTDTAQKYNLYQHARFNTIVDQARWDDAEQKWKISVTAVQGSKEAEFNPKYEITSDFLVSGVGQLNQPRWPDAIPGLHDFGGKLIHSARWDWSYDLAGKRIAVIGNGATAVQIVPEISKVASHVTVYQRSPNWITPRMDAPVSDLTQTLYKYVPPLRWRKRSTMMDFRESTHVQFVNSQSDTSEMTRQLCIDMMHTALPDQPELWKKLTPTYKPGCKRIIVSDDYYPALARDNVDLETRSIEAITKTGISVKDADGSTTSSSQDFDLIVCATGFQTLDFMAPIKIIGENNTPLANIWSSGARALNGVTVEGLPNFGMLYGPNTNLGHNSIILMIEAQSRYINGLISAVLSARRAGKKLNIRPKTSRVESYNKKIQHELSTSAFADPSCNSWYKNDEGLITNNWPGTVIDYQKQLEKVDWSDYDIEGDGKDVVEGTEESHVGRVREESYLSDFALAAVSMLGVAAVVAGFVGRNSRLLHRIRI